MPKFVFTDIEILMPPKNVASLFYENEGSVEVYKKGKILFNVTDNVENIYLLKSGEVKITENTTKPAQVTILTKGQFFGEENLLPETKKKYKVEVKEDTVLLVFSKENLKKIILNEKGKKIEFIQNLLNKLFILIIFMF